MPLKDLSFNAVIQVLHFASEHVQHKHHKEQTNVRSPEWLSDDTVGSPYDRGMNLFFLSFLSWSTGLLVVMVYVVLTCSLGAGPNPPINSIATCAFSLLSSKGTIISLMMAALSSGVDVVINGTNLWWLWYS